MDWIACANEPSEWLRWIECHIGFGTYLQIAGVAAAILGTALITRWSTHRSLQPFIEERERRAKVLTYLLLPAVSDIKATAVRVKLAFEQTESGMLLASAGRSAEAVYYFQMDTKLSSDILKEMHVLDPELAETVAQLHYYLDRYNDFIERNVPRLQALDADGRAKFSETFQTLFGTVETLASKGWDALQNARAVEISSRPQL